MGMEQLLLVVNIVLMILTLFILILLVGKEKKDTLKMMGELKDLIQRMSETTYNTIQRDAKYIENINTIKSQFVRLEDMLTQLRFDIQALRSWVVKYSYDVGGKDNEGK